MKKKRAAPPPPDPWTHAELAEHMRKLCGIQFSVGPMQEDPKTQGFKFWVMLPTANEIGARLAMVRVSPALQVTVDMAVQDAESRRVVTLLRENLEALAARRV